MIRGTSTCASGLVDVSTTALSLDTQDRFEVTGNDLSRATDTFYVRVPQSNSGTDADFY